jgi:hypothetical protein
MNGPQLETAHGRATRAAGLLGALVAFEAFSGAVVVLDSLVGPFSVLDDVNTLLPWVLESMLWVACGVTFLLWVRGVHRAALATGARPAREALRKATVGYFIPIVGLWWPFVGLRALDRAIDPESLPEPPPRPESGAHALGYRDGARREERGTKSPSPPFGWWWGVWMITRLRPVTLGPMSTRLLSPGHFSLLLLWPWVFDVPAAILAIIVIRRIDARLAERARRVAQLAAPR